MIREVYTDLSTYIPLGFFFYLTNEVSVRAIKMKTVQKNISDVKF